MIPEANTAILVTKFNNLVKLRKICEHANILGWNESYAEMKRGRVIVSAKQLTALSLLQRNDRMQDADSISLVK